MSQCNNETDTAYRGLYNAYKEAYLKGHAEARGWIKTSEEMPKPYLPVWVYNEKKAKRIKPASIQRVTTGTILA